MTFILGIITGILLTKAILLLWLVTVTRYRDIPEVADLAHALLPAFQGSIIEPPEPQMQSIEEQLEANKESGEETPLSEHL